ncbi:MAG: hypothetical protein ACR2HF_00130 [Methylococcaceae bacterium]
MNTPPALVFAPFLAICLMNQSAEAHTQLGALGNSAQATDIYLATCQDDGSGPPDYLQARIIDLPPVARPIISLNLSKDGKSAVTNDPKDGDVNYGPLVSLKAGKGGYTLTVAKSAKGAEIYRFEFHCNTAAKVHTGSAIVKKQDQ